MTDYIKIEIGKWMIMMNPVRGWGYLKYEGEPKAHLLSDGQIHSWKEDKDGCPEVVIK